MVSVPYSGTTKEPTNQISAHLVNVREKIPEVLVLLIEGLKRIFVLAISILLVKYCILNKSIKANNEADHVCHL